jgi:D-lactate dehydrogenase (cytochrome)
MPHDCSFLADLDLEGAVSFGDSERDHHAGDWGTADADQVRPDAVVFAESTADVSAVLDAADERRVPVTPFAAGTSLEANATPVHEGISLDLTRMDRVLEVRPGDFQVDVEPGVFGSAVNEAVADHGLFFPPLPSSGDISTIGGMIANDASGMQTVKYGEVGDWVLELEAVLADGTVIEPGSKAAKTSSGYNLAELLVGSEGTLAVVTRATLQLAGRPEQIHGGRALFGTLDDAVAAVFDAVRSGVDVAKIELIDPTSAMMANEYSGTSLPDGPMVFLEFHANHGIQAEIEFCRTVFEGHDLDQFEVAAHDDGMAELWQARKDLAFAIESFDPDRTHVSPGDVTVPISEYPAMVRFVKDQAAEHELLIPCFGHAGDGNLHYTVLVDESDPEELARGKAVSERIIRKAIELRGTATGEHGIGTGKREYLVAEHGEGTVEAMRRIKRALDPNDTLNPGKIFPETADGGRLWVEPPSR